MNQRTTALLAVLGLLTLDPATGAAKRAKSPEPPPPIPCKAPVAVASELAAGLDLYLDGHWDQAIAQLQRWAAGADAAKDPAADRGFYALGYALQMAGRPEDALRWMERAEPLLGSHADQAPSLETWYYLASLYRFRQDTARQLEVTARALRELDAGRLCPAGDGDDLFRLARLAGFAGRDEQQGRLLAGAAAAYGSGQGGVRAYRALAERELGDQAFKAGDFAAASDHLAAAARLDRGQHGVHRRLGLALLEQDRIGEAAAHWRQNWRWERDGGNDLIYAIRVIDDVRRYRERFGAEHRVADLEEYTVPALEQNALLEARTFLTLQARTTEAGASGGALSDEELLQMAVADYRMNQFLLEYVRRGKDLAELALANGLLAAIHGHALPG
jgi:tetratricopeptide (TPR) repeat protein